MYANHTSDTMTHINILILSPFPSRGIKRRNASKIGIAHSQNATHSPDRGGFKTPAQEKWYLGVSTELMYCAVRGIHSDGKRKARPSRDVE